MSVMISWYYYMVQQMKNLENTYKTQCKSYLFPYPLNSWILIFLAITVEPLVFGTNGTEGVPVTRNSVDGKVDFSTVLLCGCPEIHKSIQNIILLI